MIGKFAVLFGIKNLQQRRCCISLVVTAHFIDLVQKHQRIFHACLDQPVGDPSRHSSHVCSSVSTDLRFIPDTAKTDTDIFFIQCSCYGARDRCFSGSRRSDQTEDRAAALLCQCPHGKKFQNSLFHFFQTVVIRFQNLARFVEVLIVSGRFLPRQL